MSRASDELEQGVEELLEPSPAEIKDYKARWPQVVSHAKRVKVKKEPRPKRYVVQSRFGYDGIECEFSESMGFDPDEGWKDYAQYHSLPRAQRLARRMDMRDWYTEYRVQDRGPAYDRGAHWPLGGDEEAE